MIHRPAWLRPALGCVLLLAFAGHARQASAEFFQYSTTTTFTSPTFPSSTVTISVTPIASNVNDENYDATGIGTDIVFANISVLNLNHSFAGASGLSIPYSFTISISDFPTFAAPGIPPSLHIGTFTVAGTLTGSIGPGSKVNLATVPSITSANPQLIGTEMYTLALNPYVPPGPTTAGAFGLHVMAVNTPEPGTLPLLGLGALTLATSALRRWRRKPRSSG